MDKAGAFLDDPFGPMRSTLIPVFALYGEQHSDPAPEPVHVETIHARSHLHDWIIRPHRHGILQQVFWIRRGDGTLTLEGEELAFSAPRLFIMPPGVVHGFRFRRGTQGHVLTLTSAFLDAHQALLGPSLRRDEVSSLDAAPLRRCQHRLSQAFRAVQRSFDAAHELERAPGQAAQLVGAVLTLLGMVEQLSEETGSSGRPPSRAALLTSRFRALIDAQFRASASLPQHARQLGVSAAQLTRACRQVTGRSPLMLLQDRRLLEGVRLLTHTSLSVAEIAYASGFSDPAYFSRFVARRSGMPPSALRRRARGAVPAPSSEI
ncbi:helix-turn-helix domain-containing protein [Teichococcus vastitatis]|uniref:Helix-turn-helix domain-containing protein n=1 Tax=Teichococcus vastitatis TaxID=2307076 RepID=A0ABS9W002_9PROT|nr:helix-turn-helix domain-containing protein [Pseudoroseomonas vastitatis]MCI0752615.1 helix-turn-helix domain-containing protein [Pseudoroseomonas vastitatis]